MEESSSQGCKGITQEKCWNEIKLRRQFTWKAINRNFFMMVTFATSKILFSCPKKCFAAKSEFWTLVLNKEAQRRTEIPQCWRWQSSVAPHLPQVVPSAAWNPKYTHCYLSYLQIQPTKMTLGMVQGVMPICPSPSPDIQTQLAEQLHPSQCPPCRSKDWLHQSCTARASAASSSLLLREGKKEFLLNHLIKDESITVGLITRHQAGLHSHFYHWT